MSSSVSLQNLKKGNVDLNCNKTCGHISDYLHCSHVNGTCRTGYKPVYEEDRCQKGKNLYYTSENDKTIKNPLVNRNLKIIRTICVLYLYARSDSIKFVCHQECSTFCKTHLVIVTTCLVFVETLKSWRNGWHGDDFYYCQSYWSLNKRTTYLHKCMVSQR